VAAACGGLFDGAQKSTHTIAQQLLIYGSSKLPGLAEPGECRFLRSCSRRLHGEHTNSSATMHCLAQYITGWPHSLVVLPMLRFLVSFAAHPDIALSAVVLRFVSQFFVIGHDCGHRSFSENKLLEDIVGTLAFMPLIYPFEPWRIKHNQHHAQTNK
jgi:hypothetical protein